MMKTEKVGVPVKCISLEFEKLLNPRLMKYDLTVSQYKLLGYLFRHKADTVIQADMEKFFSMTHPTTSGLIKQLTKKGYVVRKKNPGDARSRVIMLTDKALEMEETLTGIADAANSELTSSLTGEEREALILILNKVLAAFDKSFSE